MTCLSYQEVCDKTGKSGLLDIDNRPRCFFYIWKRTSPAIFVVTSAETFRFVCVLSSGFNESTHTHTHTHTEKFQHIRTLQNNLQYIANIYSGDWVVEISKWAEQRQRSGIRRPETIIKSHQSRSVLWQKWQREWFTMRLGAFCSKAIHMRFDYSQSETGILEERIL